MMRHFIPFLVLMALVFPLRSGAEEIIKKGESLNVERCVEIALREQPTITAAKSAVDANSSRVGEARANYYPQIGWTAAYNRISSVTSTSSLSAISSTPGRSNNNAFNQYSSSISLNQNIFDFWKTRTQVDIQKLNLDSSKSDLDTTAEQVVFAVKQAYYGLLQAQKNMVVAEETVRQNEQHLEQAKGFYEVGTKPKYDVTTAEVNLSNAKLSLIKAANAIKLARVTLNNTMGVPEAPEYSIDDNLSFRQYGVTLEEAIQTAYKNRPDLQSIIFKRQAAESSVELAIKGYYPVLTGNAALNWAGQDFPLNHGWNVGLNITLPVFSGFLTKNQVEEAKANLAVLRANEESLKQGILLDVQQAYLNMKVAEESIAATELTLRQATENFEIANGRYTAGVGNPIEVTDAEVSLSNAKTSNIQSLYDYKVASASMEKAIGSR